MKKSVYILLVVFVCTACGENFQRDGKATMSKCLRDQSYAPALASLEDTTDWDSEQFWLNISDYLTIQSTQAGEYNIMHHTHLICEASYHTSYVLNGNEITIRDWATTLTMADCECPVESRGHFKNVPDGTYTITVKNVNTSVKVNLHAAIDTLITVIDKSE